MDLSLNFSSRKKTDLSDPRYNMSERLSPKNVKSFRPTFSLYDGKEDRKVKASEIVYEYFVSDKHIPMGEILSKMLEIIENNANGVYENTPDAIYMWKYCGAVQKIYEDKAASDFSMAQFDNNLKSTLINSKFFFNRFPNKYTGRTNFFDEKIKKSIQTDIYTVFKEETIPHLHEIAIVECKKLSNVHTNNSLNELIEHTTEHYSTTVDTFFENKVDGDTGLQYVTNIAIFHLSNGRDVSVVGTSGTDSDDRYAIAVINAQTGEIESSFYGLANKRVKEIIADANSLIPITPLATKLFVEKERLDVLKQQNEILDAIHPIIPAEVMSMSAAKEFLDSDYIWSAQNYRLTHEDIPMDFLMKDIVLPEFDEQKVLEKLNTQNEEKNIQDAEARETQVSEVDALTESTMLPNVLLGKEQKDTDKGRVAHKNYTGEAKNVEQTKPIFKEKKLFDPTKTNHINVDDLF